MESNSNNNELNDMESNSSNSWKVICTGNIKADFTQESVIENIQALFKFDSEKAKKLIQGTPTTVKQGLGKQDALQYKKVLQEAGVETILEAPAEAKKFSFDELSLVPLDGEHCDDVNHSNQGHHSASTHEHAPEVTCPECYNLQPQTIKCLYCGTQIERDDSGKATVQRESVNSASPLQLQSQSQHQPHSHSRSHATRTAHSTARSSYNNGHNENDHNDDDFEEPETIIDKMIEHKQSIVVAICIAIVVNFLLFSGATYKAVGDSPEALAQISAFESSNYPAINAERLRGLLQSKNYYQLESLLGELNDKVHYDIRWEDAFTYSINRVSNIEKVSLEQLDNWVNSTESALAYLARGVFYASAGAEARGSKFSKNTTDAQFEAMNKLYLAAYSDLINAKSMDSSLLPAYKWLIQINVGDGTNNPRDVFLNEAILANPAGNQYRISYMNYSKPKWGGSWAQMDRFVAETQTYASLNPRLNLLSGYIFAEKADLAMRDDDDAACISYYSEALQYGIHTEWLRKRAYCLYDIGDFDEALQDITLFFKYDNYPSDYDKKLKRYLVGKVG